MLDINHLDLSGTIVLSALEGECKQASPLTGIGKINATIKTVQIIETYKPKRILNVGSCASIECPKGSIVTATWVVNDDFYMPGLAKETIYVEPIKGYQAVTVFTADQFRTPTNIGVIDMEAYAIAKVCELYHVEFQCLKIVTDSGDFGEWVNSFC